MCVGVGDEDCRKLVSVAGGGGGAVGGGQENAPRLVVAMRKGRRESMSLSKMLA